MGASTGIAWTTSPRPTLGVELELQVVDAETGDLVSLANEILADVGAGHPEGEHPKAKHELFQSIIEVITGVCDTPAEAHADLTATIAEVAAAAARRGQVAGHAERVGPLLPAELCRAHRLNQRRGARLASAGTHPFALSRDQVVSPQPRYHQLMERMQWPARRLLIFGTHVHVGVKSGERAITIINELRRHLPVFLALSASSPFFEGDDSGLSSARSKVFEALPTAGLPPQLAEWSDFEEFMQTRIGDALFTVRIDGTLPPPPREWTVRENRWLAGRYGLDADLIVDDPDAPTVTRVPARERIERLVAAVRPAALELGSAADLARHGAKFATWEAGH